MIAATKYFSWETHFHNPPNQTSDVIINPENLVNPDSKTKRQYTSANKLHSLTSDVIINPENLVNPDSKPMRSYPSANKLYPQN